ncbi:phosphopyruvate hydratase [Candidatus Microgenomates bacterium]|nr:phosphopyruvate hydratase [Candidatus Microgenomates bacterium]
MKIKNIHAREILDSRGDPTVECDVVLDDGSIGRASVPSGASTGVHEAVELRDNDPKRYGGKGVLTAVKNINTEIKNALYGMDATEIRKIDGTLLRLDGTENKSRLGANAILAVSLSCARAAAVSAKIPLYQYLRKTFAENLKDNFILPVPLVNILNGGKHADSNLDFQECIIIPIGASSFPEIVRMGSEIFHSLGQILKEKHLSTNVGNEGGYAGYFKNHAEAFQLFTQAIESAGYKSGEDACLGIDVAASSFFGGGIYDVTSEKKKFSTEEMIGYLRDLTEKYPIISIEDPLGEDEWGAWQKFTQEFGSRLQIVGDDLFVTNVKRIQQGIEQKVANAVLIKVNQIGTLSETADAILLSQKNNYRTIVSHRSGDTEDSFIADLVVALDCGQIKTGSMSRSERVVKYNRLLQISEELGGKARFLGKKTFGFLG